MLNILRKPEMDAHKAEVIGIAREIIALEDTQGWKHFVKTAEAFANNQMPRVDTVKGSEHAIELASKMAFVSGVRACIGLMQQQKDILKELTK